MGSKCAYRKNKAILAAAGFDDEYSYFGGFGFRRLVLISMTTIF